MILQATCSKLRNLTNRYYMMAILLATISVLTMSPLAIAGNGNGTPNGYHFELNILGAKTSNCLQTDGSGGNWIFVALYGTSDIFLQQGTTFAVLDDNACTDGTAQFQLPPPVNAATGATQYTIWARAEGTPNGSGTLTTCGTDTSDGANVCSLGQTIGTRDLKQHFHDITSLLTTVCGVINGTPQCVQIFNSALTNYLWSYDNQGNKVLQLRFYPTSG